MDGSGAEKRGGGRAEAHKWGVGYLVETEVFGEGVECREGSHGLFLMMDEDVYLLVVVAVVVVVLVMLLVMLLESMRTGREGLYISIQGRTITATPPD